MDILFPPVLESQGLGFEFFAQNPYQHAYDIRFDLPLGTSRQDIRHVQVSIKYLNTGEPAVAEGISPDRQVLYIDANSEYFEQESGGNYVVHIPYFAFGGGFPAKDTMYCFQVRFGSSKLWSGTITGLDQRGIGNFSAWRTAATSTIPSTFGEWSNILKGFCHGSATHEIDYDFTDFCPRVKWFYNPSGDDPINQIKLTYWYNTLHGVEMKTDIFSGQYMNDNAFSFDTVLPIAPVIEMQAAIEAVTKNNVKYHDEIPIPSILGTVNHIIPNYGKISDMEMSAPEQEDGAIGKTIHMPDDLYGCTKYSVYRIDTLTTKCIKILANQPMVNGEVISFKDFTCEMGEDYQYVVVALDKDGKCKYLLNDLLPYGDENPAYARLMRMDSSFLVSRAHQLRLQGNVSLTSFKRNTQDAFQTTIGSKYPFYSRGSQMNYRTFSLSGVVSINFDPTSAFLRLDAIGEIKPNQELTYEQYSVLVAKSPGVKPFFVQPRYDERGKPLYVFTPKRELMDEDQCIALINRCAANLMLNGLWWDSDDGESSQLYIQDRDIVENLEASLSRKRFYEEGGNVYKVLKRDGSGKILEEKWQQRYEKDLPQSLSIYDKYLHRQTGLAYGTTASDRLVYIERKFREKVMEWLADGKPKLFRSETEGNMIVQLSGVSFTPVDKSNRMVYSVSATVTEIAEFNSENLERYNLIPSLIKSVYIDNSVYEYTWGQIDTSIDFSLDYVYYSAFQIPNMEIGKADGAIAIETLPGVVNGKTPFTFSATGLPNGLYIARTDIKNDAGDLIYPAGTIYGYPRDITQMRPGFAICTVTDATGASASMDLPYGWMFEKMQQVGTPQIFSATIGKDHLDVGEKIQPLDVNNYFIGGVGPYTFSPANGRLPSGLSINGNTGVISGAYTEDIAEGEATVMVKDSLGNSLIIPITYVAGSYPLSFIKYPEWDYDYTEVGVEIPHIDVRKGITGGQKPYVIELLDDAPAGWRIGNNNGDPDGPQGTIEEVQGIIWGKPIANGPAGTFTVRVTDAVQVQRQITIAYNTILERFEFKTSPTIWVTPQKPNATVANEITLGTVMPGTDVKPQVSGGLQFTTGAPYRFDATGLLPNWQIDKNWGIISGRAQIGADEHEATLVAIDARGNKATCVIKVGKVAGGLEYLPRGLKFSNLYVGKEITNASISSTIGWGVTLEIRDSDIQNGDGPFSITLSGAPAGIYLKREEQTATQNVRYTFAGTPIEASPARTGWLTIKDKNDKSIQVQVSFEAVTANLAWDNPQTTLISGPPSQVYKRSIGATGGVAPFTVTYSDNDAVKVIDVDKNDISTWQLEFTLPDTGRQEKAVTVTIKDAVETITKGFILKTTVMRMNLTKTRDFRNVHVMQNHAVFDHEVMEISGGLPPYSIKSGDIINGSMKFVVVGSKVKVVGTPSNLVTDSANIADNLVIRDSEGTEVSLTGSLFGPIVDPQPSIGPKIQNNEIKETSLLYGSYYSSPSIFENLIFPGTEIILEGSYPTGVIGERQNATYIVQGRGEAITAEDTIMDLTLRTQQTEYDTTPIILKVRVIFGAIRGVFEFYIPSSVVMPALSKDQKMDNFIVSMGLSGGVGKFTWTAINLPAGLSIKSDNDDGREAWIEGTPSELKGSGQITITVKDESNGITKTANLTFKGIYPPMTITKDTVTIKVEPGKTFTEINLTECFSGGQEPYSYSEEGTLLKDRKINVEPFSGLIKAEEGGVTNLGFPAQETYAIIRDSNGLTAKIKVKIEEIKGDLNFYSKVNGVNVEIPKGARSSSVTGKDLPVIAAGVCGGTKPYTYKESDTNGWTKHKFTATLASATGVFSNMKRPTSQTSKGSFDVIVTDANGNRVTIPIKFGEVT